MVGSAIAYLRAPLPFLLQLQRRYGDFVHFRLGSYPTHEDLMALTLRIVTRTLFSTDVADVTRDVGQALAIFSARYASMALMMFPFLTRAPLPADRHETTALALSYTLHLLSGSPAVEKRLRVLPDPPLSLLPR